jgi:two-component system cell cycle response regulator DivK
VHADTLPELRTVQAAAVLIVLDEPTDRHDLYDEYLQFCGFQVATARDVDEGLHMARSAAPSVIVMDMSARVPDAWARVREFKQDPELSHIPVVAIAPFALDRAALARESGADAWLARPCLPSQIARTIRVLLVTRQ